jgi:predicted TIM-barrel fold metal-dependent hydrolase
MLIVDSQVHIWASDSPERPWPRRAPPQRALPLGTDELIDEMHAAGVDRAVIVPPSWEGERNDLALAAAQLHPQRFAVMGRLDPTSPTARDLLPGWRAQPGMLGLRFALKVHWSLLTEGHLDWVWGEAERHGVPIYVLVSHARVHLIDAVAERHPGLRLVMDHMGMTGEQKDEAAFKDYDKVLALARHPNVAAKISALPCFSTDKYPYRSLHPYIRRAFDAFGPRRLFWGTDLSRSPIPYRQHVTLFTEELPWLAGADLEWVMGRGVCEWLGWNVRARSDAARVTGASRCPDE